MHLPKEPGRFQKACVKRVALLPWLDPNRRLALLAQHLRVFGYKHLKVISRRQGNCRARGTPYAREHSENKMEITSPSKKERHFMHLLFTPVLASAIWIGGGTLGIIIVVILLVLLLRR
jgi:hypothetical protein